VTFSIVACDADTQQLGVAVASKFLAVGAVVPWLECEVGAIATQALANTRYGPEGLALMREGASAREALDAVLEVDRGRDDRQAGFVDAMAEAYEAAAGALAERLLLALAAGDAAGGDRRGRQSAAIAVVAPAGGYGGNDDNLVDLRVDDHAEPVGELQRIHGIHVLLTGTTPEEQKLPLSGGLGDEVRDLLARAGYPSEPGADGLDSALRAFVGTENLEARWWHEERLDPVVLEHLRSRAAG
jgi:uncharacterized Ntn-hydrolase superfamily protein